MVDVDDPPSWGIAAPCAAAQSLRCRALTPYTSSKHILFGNVQTVPEKRKISKEAPPAVIVAIATTMTARSTIQNRNLMRRCDWIENWELRVERWERFNVGEDSSCCKIWSSEENLEPFTRERWSEGVGSFQEKWIERINGIKTRIGTHPMDDNKAREG